MKLITPIGDDGIIQRQNMPQVDDPDIPTLLSYLGSFEIGFSAGFIDPKEVKAHPAIDVARAKAIPLKFLKTPVLMSKEPYIIDGDHRWYRHSIDGTMMPFIRIEEDFDTALGFIFSFPKTFTEAV